MLTEEQCERLGIDYQVYKETARLLFDKVFGPAIRAIQELAQALVEALQPLMDAIIDACKKLYDAVYAEYRERGAIYGDTHEGMMRWVEELTTIVRLRQEAEYLEQRHQMLAEMRL